LTSDPDLPASPHTLRMGANTSSSSYPTVASSGSGGNSNSSSSNGNLSALPMGMGEMSGGAGAYGSGSSCGPSGNAGGAPGIVISGAHYHRDQRRKRATGFATLKRKFIRRRRSSKACDHARVLRDFVSDWAPVELAALCEEFEALSALRDLSVSITFPYNPLLDDLLTELSYRCKPSWHDHRQPHLSRTWPPFMKRICAPIVIWSFVERYSQSIVQYYRHVVYIFGTCWQDVLVSERAYVSSYPLPP